MLYLIVGTLTAVAFMSPLAAIMGIYVMMYLPALFFGYIAVYQAGAWLSLGRQAAIVGVCLAAYALGERLISPGGVALPVSPTGRLFLAPSAAAIVTLVGFGLISGRIREWSFIPKMTLGAAGGALSGLPLCFA